MPKHLVAGGSFQRNGFDPSSVRFKICRTKSGTGTIILQYFPVFLIDVSVQYLAY